MPPCCHSCQAQNEVFMVPCRLVWPGCHAYAKYSFCCSHAWCVLAILKEVPTSSNSPCEPLVLARDEDCRLSMLATIKLAP